MKNIPFCPRKHDADHVRNVQHARGAVVRPARHRRQHVWTCPQPPASAGRLLLRSRTGSSCLCLEGPAHVCEVSCQSWWRPCFWTWWQFKEKSLGSMSSSEGSTVALLQPWQSRGENPLQQLESMLEFVTFLDNKQQRGRPGCTFPQRQTWTNPRRRPARQSAAEMSTKMAKMTLMPNGQTPSMIGSLIPLVKLRYQGSHVPSCLGSLCTILPWGSLCAFQVLTELLCVVTSLSFCLRECRSHYCWCQVGLRPIVFGTQAKLRIMSLHVFRQFHRLHNV